MRMLVKVWCSSVRLFSTLMQVPTYNGKNWRHNDEVTYGGDSLCHRTDIHYIHHGRFISETQ
jgi:hypothetical protein